MTSRIKYNNPFSVGQLGLAYHYEMLSDGARVAPFLKAIQASCKGKIVIESGTGSGVLSILAARAGASKVYSVEIDPVMAECAENNFKLSGYSNIKILKKSTLEVNLKDLDGNRPEVIIAENLSTWQVTEPEVEIMNHITQFLAEPDAVRLPEIIHNYIELAQSEFTFYETVKLRAHFFEFSGVRRPKVLSKPQLFSKFDFSKTNPTHNRGYVDIRVKDAGIVNSLRLTSPLTVYKDIKFDSTDSLMPPVVVPLPSDLSVKSGDTVRVGIEYETSTVWEDFVVTAEVLTKDKKTSQASPAHQQ